MRVFIAFWALSALWLTWVIGRGWHRNIPEACLKCADYDGCLYRDGKCPFAGWRTKR